MSRDCREFFSICMCVVLSIVFPGCIDGQHGPPPRGPYKYRDYSDTMRAGGDFIEMVVYKPGRINHELRPPKLLYPLDRMVFSHFPREIVYRWESVEGTPIDSEYLFELDFTTGSEERFGDWSKEAEPIFAYRTGHTTLNDRFVGGQPGRWRVKVINTTGESEWSQWRYFRFTQ